MRRNPPSPTRVTACHVTARITQVPSSGATITIPLPLCTDSLFRKWEGEKITDQRLTNSLTSSSCLSTFKTSCVFSSKRETKKAVTYWSADRGRALCDNNPTPPQRREREGEKGWEKTTHEDTFEDIFTHSLYTMRPYLMSLSYWRLPGLCWFLLWSGETPRAGSKGEEVSALLGCQTYESHSEWLTCLSAPHPMAALPHYQLKPITTFFILFLKST